MMAAVCDVVVIGAGPAGMAAALEAAAAGAQVVLLDEQSEPGGQIYRGIESTPLTQPETLGPDYWHGLTLVQALRQSQVDYRPGAMVWAVSAQRAAGQGPDAAPAGYELAYSIAGQAHMIQARQVVVATGAQERPMAIDGWTLPGVLTAGAAQILLKTSAVVPSEPAVLVGTGPLLYLLAWQYLNAGGRIAALLETAATPRSWSLGDAWAFLRSPYFSKGMRLLREVRRHVRIVRNVHSLRAVGQSSLQAMEYRVGQGPAKTLATAQAFLHHGVVPNVNLSRALRLDHRWNPRNLCWDPVVDAWGQTSAPGILLCGDGAGIGGARVAECKGRLVGLQAALLVSRLASAQRDQRAWPWRAALALAQRGRAFLDARFQPLPALLRPEGEVVVCRCEEVTARQVRETVALGCPGPNQMKTFLRCGMGPCQGRLCGLTVSELMADEQGVSPEQVGYYRLRFPLKPLTLGEVASLPQTQASAEAVVRIKKPGAAAAGAAGARAD